MTFSGRAGTTNSRAGNMVAGFGVTTIRYSKSFSASMTPGATVYLAHTYIFTIVSIVLYRAVSRAKHFISVFRTQ